MIRSILKKRNILLCLLFVPLILSLITGCSGSEDSGAGGQDDAGDSIVFTDMKGKEIRLDGPVSRAVALTAADCEILYALGAGDILVGRGEYCDYPEEALQVPAVQSGREANIEQIIALKPEAVFMGTMNQTEDQISSLEAAGVKVIVSEAIDIEGVYRSIEMIGIATGKKAEAEQLVVEMQSEFRKIGEKAAAQQMDGKKSIYFEVSPLEWGLWAAGRETFMDELAEMIGVENIFRDISGWAEVSQEQVISRNPEYIITIAMYYGDGLIPEEEILQRSGWQTIDAIKNGDVYHMDSDEMSRPGPRLVKAAEMLYGLIYEQ